MIVLLQYNEIKLLGTFFIGARDLGGVANSTSSRKAAAPQYRLRLSVTRQARARLVGIRVRRSFIIG